ncbi:GNAT family N-acetyltransferase [Pseudomonas sp. F1_0610]|uniref:GNAT family N-acetyltransferase n=1 Tax=Pseudomonas sp. F1_0610 TaxID=3114284 RepID=UPI0039C130B3
MLNYFKAYRERGWQDISAQEYSAAWQTFGGSVATHPDIVERLSDFAQLQVSYLGWFEGEQLQAALPVTGRYLALSKDCLKHAKKRHLFDLGNAEIILPVAQEAQVLLRHKVRYLSALNSQQIVSAKPQKESLALARQPEEYSKKFRYNQRREQRLLEEAGGSLVPMENLSTQEIASIYTSLFERRWGFPVPGKGHLVDVFNLLREFMVGNLVYLDNQPVAIQILYRVEAPNWVSLEYINGGVDPQQREFSPGSVLSFVNTQEQWAYAREQGKTLRYSFGRSDREYKDRWCNNHPVYEVR